jgi:hypothetical protein
MKWAKNRGIGAFLSLLALGIIVLMFQNCSSQQSGTGLSIGTSPSTSTTPAPTVVAPSGVIYPSTGPFLVNQSITFMLNISNGRAPYSITWTATPVNANTGNCTNNTACSLSFSAAGSVNVVARIQDANGGILFLNSNITISTTAPSPTPTPGQNTCPQDYGWIDAATVDPTTCQLTVKGWAWSIYALQNTKVAVRGGAGVVSKVVVSESRDGNPGVHDIIPCIPNSAGGGNPGFTVKLSFLDFPSDTYSVTANIENSSGANEYNIPTAGGNTFNVSVPPACISPAYHCLPVNRSYFQSECMQ